MVQLLGLYVLSSSFGLCNIELYMFLKLVSQQLELIIFLSNLFDIAMHVHILSSFYSNTCI